MQTKTILDKVLRYGVLAKEEILYLLDLSERSQREQLFAAARQLRQRCFGNKVFFVRLCLFFHLLSQ